MKRTEKRMIELLRKQAKMFYTFWGFYDRVGNATLAAEYMGKYRATQNAIYLLEDDVYFSCRWEEFENESEVDQ